MNIKAVSNTNFKAKMLDRDYDFDILQNTLFERYGIGAQDILDFQEKLKKLPLGEVEIDQYVEHGGADYVFGTIHKPCGKKTAFDVKTYDGAFILDEIFDAVAEAFKETCTHKKCVNYKA